MDERRITGNWTMYRKPRDLGLWLRFDLLCTALGLSQSGAATQAVSDWVDKNDPEGKYRMEWTEQ